MTKNFNFDQIIDRRNSKSIKWQMYDKDVLPLWVADMDFTAPPCVIQALMEQVRHGVFGYPCEVPEIKSTVVDWCAERYSWQITPEDIILVPGVITGFNLASHAFAAPNGSILYQTPAYPPFLTVASNTGINEQSVELSQAVDGSYFTDEAIFAKTITPDTRMFLLCNPQNPTGRVFRKPELEKIAEICLRNKIIICSDEIHCDLIYSGHRHIPIASLDREIALSTITLFAPSKTFNIAGLEASIAVVQNPDLRQQLYSSVKGLVGWVNLMGLVAMQAAYQDGKLWLESLLGYLEANRDFLYSFINKELPMIKMSKPEGSYLAWLDCRDAGLEQNPYEFFLQKARVALNDGEKFGKGGAGFVRLNFGCPRATLEEALGRMKDALQNK